MEEEEEIKVLAMALALYAAILMMIVIIVACLVLLHEKGKEHKVNIGAVNVIEAQGDVEMISEWEYLIQALIMVESEGNALAVGKTNDVGILQITPIYVREVNRILQQDIYNLSDRTDIDKSLAMFEVYQEHHNPDKDIERAIKLHNPRAGQSYTNKVMNQFNQLIQS